MSKVDSLKKLNKSLLSFSDSKVTPFELKLCVGFGVPVILIGFSLINSAFLSHEPFYMSAFL